MTEERKDQLWQRALADAQSLDAQAQKTDEHVTYMTDALVLTIQAMYTNDMNGDKTYWERDKADLLDLFQKLGAYTIHRNDTTLRITFTAEYDELNDIFKEVLDDQN